MTNPPLETIRPHVKDLGGFEVRRALPSRSRKTIGPFIFWDHMGPAQFAPGDGVAVRPHPHIGLATVTYLFDGEIMHRDSVGSVQRISPGDVNWMIAGRGIVHSERTPDESRAAGSRLHGIQTWLALPRAEEETAPAFAHHPKRTLPEIGRRGARGRVIAGHAFGERAPVQVFSGTLYVAIELDAGAQIVVPDEHPERAIYVVEGDLRAGGSSLPPLQVSVLPQRGEVRLEAASATRLMLFGGDPVDGERFIWWNFVSSSKERIDQASRDWRDGRFDPVPGETEFIPLPPR